jgi:LisH
MAIVIKAEHLDAIVHKYMLEMGYLHSAYLFEKEASVNILGDISKKILPNYLPKLCEQALILRSLEIHQDLDESLNCTAELNLIDLHVCSITEKNLAERRQLLARINEQAAIQLKSDLKVQEEARNRDNKPTNKPFVEPVTTTREIKLPLAQRQAHKYNVQEEDLDLEMSLPENGIESPNTESSSEDIPKIETTQIKRKRGRPPAPKLNKQIKNKRAKSESLSDDESFEEESPLVQEEELN